MALTIFDIGHLLSVRGQSQYGGEAISQRDHALQCAHLAEQAGEAPETVVASLLHDLGHMLSAERDGRTDDSQERDDLHQTFVIPFLRSVFTDAVLEPIRLHVDAKRYLCTAEPSYWDTLSPASRLTLELQGGAYTPEQAQRFISQPYATEAVRLRRYDDQAKVPDLITPPLDHFMSIVATVVLASAASVSAR